MTFPLGDAASTFSADRLHATIDAALKAIPADKTGALLVDATLGADGTPRLQALIAQRIGDSWSIAAGTSYDGHAVEGHVAIVGAWGGAKTPEGPASHLDTGADVRGGGAA